MTPEEIRFPTDEEIAIQRHYQEQLDERGYIVLATNFPAQVGQVYNMAEPGVCYGDDNPLGALGTLRVIEETTRDEFIAIRPAHKFLGIENFFYRLVAE